MIYSLILTNDIFSINILTDTENYWSVRRRTHYDVTDKNNDV
jgi:hypothetical protein